MIDYLLQYATSNLLLSVVLAALAYGIHRRGRYPALAHLLWVLVLVKVITPPLLVLPVSLGPAVAGPVGSPAVGSAAVLGRASMAVGDGSGVSSALSWIVSHGPALLVLAWLLGSALVLATSWRRIRSFSRLLGQSSVVAPPETQGLAIAVAHDLGLRSAPTVYLSRARLSPMTWWTGRRLRIILPAALADQVDGRQLRWILAHELAHIKRRDHVVRWLEWLACVAFWWNPVVWLARRFLRLDEEDACDALVLERLEGQPRSYARTLLTVVEILAQPAARTPSLATGIDAADSLERRLTRIVSPVRRKRASRRLAAGVMTVAVATMALGIGGASDYRTGPREPGQAGVEGEAALPQTLASRTGADVPPDQDRYAMLGARVSGMAGTEAAGVSADARRASGDLFVGTADADTYAGTDRDETIIGRAGADELVGGAGRDSIRGGKGADTIQGGKGADTISGDAGRDRLSGGAGNDTISGGGEHDVIDGGSGRDVIDAGAGNDLVRTWQDGVPDRVDCGRGDADRAVVDSTDTVLRCEAVVVRDPS